MNMQRSSEAVSRRSGNSAHKGNRGSPRRRFCCADEVEYSVERLGEPGVRTEVDCQLHGFAADTIPRRVQRTDAMIADMVEELNFCLPEHINRLHGIADKKTG